MLPEVTLFSILLPVKKESYHHGNLKNAILKEGEKLLKKKGASELTLREVAQKIGVSHAAVYRHFQNKEELLAELSALGFTELRKKQSSIRFDPQEPETFFVELGFAYIKFALENPQFYRIMFQTTGLGDHRVLFTASLRSYAVLVHGSRRFLKAKKVNVHYRSFALMSWSLVHGFSMLCLDTNFPKTEADVLKTNLQNLAKMVLSHSVTLPFLDPKRK